MIQTDRKADTLCHTLAIVRAEKQVDKLAYRLAEVDVVTLI